MGKKRSTAIQKLAKQRWEKLEAILSQKQMSISELAQKLDTPSLPSKTITSRIHSYRRANGRCLLPIEMAQQMAPVLDVQPSDIYIRLAPKEKKHVPGADAGKGETKSPAKKKTRKTSSTPAPASPTESSGSVQSKAKGNGKGIKVQITCAELGIKMEDTLVFQTGTMQFAGTNSRIGVDPKPALHIDLSLLPEAASALLMRIMGNK